MQKPEVSIIIPVYNTEKYLEKCLSTVFAQTLSSIEVIMVDDGSTDQSIAIEEKYLHLYPDKTKLIRSQNQGAGSARNKGMDAAQGKYLLFLDADDYFDEKLAERLYLSCEQNQSQLSVCKARGFFSEDGPFEDLWYAFREDFMPQTDTFNYKEYADYIFTMFLGWAWDKMFLHSFVVEQKLRFQELRSSNDLYFVFMALVSADKISLVRESLVNYRMSNANSLHNTREKSWDCFYIANTALKKALVEKGVYETVKKAYLNWSADYIYSQLRSLPAAPALEKSYALLKQSGLKEIGILEENKEYYYFKDGYRFCQFISKHTYQEYVIYRSVRSSMAKVRRAFRKLLNKQYE